jgi:hypothetical protein
MKKYDRSDDWYENKYLSKGYITDIFNQAPTPNNTINGSSVMPEVTKDPIVVQASMELDYGIFEKFPHDVQMQFLRNRVDITDPNDEIFERSWLNSNCTDLYTIKEELDNEDSVIYFANHDDKILFITHYT